MLTQRRPGALGALLLHSCVPTAAFEAPWPEGVPLEIHAMEQDEWFELDVAEALVAAVPGTELFLYPGSGHLFADASLGDYDPDAAGLMTERVLAFLESAS
jgi:dienelactone hydrolase